MKKILFIGAGKMATALAGGMVRGGFEKGSVSAYEISEKAASAFTQATGIATVPSLNEAIRDSDAVVLAVKPQVAENVLRSTSGALNGRLLISIAAGVTISSLAEWSCAERVIRVMPNTPALVGEGMSCFAVSQAVTEEDSCLAMKILESAGRVRRVNENQLDAVTGLSGSAPAFVMEFIMALADGGVYAGLPRDLATELAVQTVLGSALLCRESTRHIAELRDGVISPAGTTARGIMALQEGAFKAVTAQAVIQAALRSSELAKK